MTEWMDEAIVEDISNGLKISVLQSESESESDRRDNIVCGDGGGEDIGVFGGNEGVAYQYYQHCSQISQYPINSEVIKYRFS